MDVTHDGDDELGELWARITTSDGTDRADALIELGGHLLHDGDATEALAAVDAATDLFEAAGDTASGELAAAHHNAAVVLHALGRIDDAARRHQRAVDIHLTRWHTHDAAHCLSHTADLLALSDDPARAMDAFDRAAAMFEADGEAHDAGHTLIRAAQTALTIDKPGWARDRIRRARALLEQLGDVRALGHCELLTARLQRRRHHTAAALRSLRRATQLLDSVGDDIAIAEALVLRVELLADAGLDEDAIALAQGLRAELRQADDAEAVARCDLAAGRALLHLGDRDRAVDVLEAAATVLAAVGRKGDADTARRLVLASSRDDRK